MTIDWFTTSAQIINFLILLWILKKLLFRPIVHAMEQREQEQAKHLQQVEVQRCEVQALKVQYEKELQQLHHDKEQFLKLAEQQAKTEKDRLLVLLNEEIQQKKTQFEQQIQHDQQQYSELIKQTIIEKSLNLSHKVLTQLADQTLEQCITEQFLKNLADLPEVDQLPIKHALLGHSPAVFISCFQLNDTRQEKIRDWFDNFAPGSQLIFQQRDALLCGVALEANGQSWEWNIDRYLTELRSELIMSTES